jgi:hypothetical protein
VFGKIDGLAWVLENGRMLFPPSMSRRSRSIRCGDRFFFYSSRSLLRDAGRVIGEAEVTSGVTTRHEPIRLAGKEFNYECGLRLLQLTPFGGGVVFIDVLYRLSAFPDPLTYSAALRRNLVRLGQGDDDVLRAELQNVARRPSEVLDTYFMQTARSES